MTWKPLQTYDLWIDTLKYTEDSNILKTDTIP